MDKNKKESLKKALKIKEQKQDYIDNLKKSTGTNIKINHSEKEKQNEKDLKELLNKSW